MARIGGKGMSYIVKNCPACHNYYSNIYECHQMDDCDDNSCSSYTDCVIKQVIEKLKDSKLSYSKLEILRTACETNQAYGKAVMAEQLLQLFDIEEMNK